MGLSSADFDIASYFNQEAAGSILVISGWRGVGKTSFCMQAVEKMKQQGSSVAGILSPARFEGSVKTGIYSVKITNGESRLAASTMSGEIDGFRLGPYYFDQSVITWADNCIREIVECDVLVIDELGYLEFDSHAGLFSSFEKLKEKCYHLALVVIRPERIEAFRQMGFVFDEIQIEKDQHLA